MKYKVYVVRTSFSSRVIEVEANSESEATEIAVDKAGDYEFPEHGADYEADYVELVDQSANN